jgi:hypothetical protein
VFNHEHRVAEIAQVFERSQQAIVVPIVQADGRLVENVEDAAQLRSDLCRQTNSRLLSTGNVAADRPSEMYPSPTSCRNCKRSVIVRCGQQYSSLRQLDFRAVSSARDQQG